MNDYKKKFTGIDVSRQQEYELYLALSFNRTQDSKLKKALTNLNYDKFLEDSAEIPQDLAETFRNKLAPDSCKVQNLIHIHYQSLCKVWTPERTSYIGLSQMYREYEEFNKFFDKFEPGLAEFIVQAMKIYAKRRL